MSLPYRIQVEAALSSLEALPDKPTNVAVARKAYAKAMTLGKFGVRAMIQAESLLAELGLAVLDENRIFRTQAGRDYLRLDLTTACEAVVYELLASGSRPWLGTAIGQKKIHYEYIPDNDSDALTSLVLDAAKREELLLAAARRYDDTRRVEDGLLGEEMVVTAVRHQLKQAGRIDLASRVQRLSSISDQLGYDVRAYTTEGDIRRLEVKATRLADDIRVFVSRNEIEYGASDNSWFLVVCRIGPHASGILGFCACAPLLRRLPIDTDTGRWQTASILLAETDLTPGLPC